MTDAQKKVLEYLYKRPDEYRRIKHQYSRSLGVLEKKGFAKRGKRDMFENDSAPFGFPMQYTVWMITDEGKAQVDECPCGFSDKRCRSIPCFDMP